MLIVNGFDVSVWLGLLCIVLSSAVFLLNVNMWRVFFELIIVLFCIAKHVRDVSDKLA